MGKRSPRLLIAEPGTLPVTVGLLKPKELGLQIALQPDSVKERTVRAGEVWREAKWGPCMLRLAGDLPMPSGLE